MQGRVGLMQLHCVLHSRNIVSGMPTGQRKHVVIIGGGFGGLNAAKALTNTSVDVTLIDRTNHHLFQPLLYQVATAALSPGDIAQPIRAVLKRARNVRVVMDEVVGIDVDRRIVSTPNASFAYDHLILAAGSRHSYFGRDNWEVHAPGLKDLNDALHIRRQLLLTFEKAEAAIGTPELHQLLTFVVVGGGPTGVELAGAIAEIALRTMLPDFPRLHRKQIRIVLIEGQDRILSSFDPKLSRKATRALTRMGVEVLTSTRVENISEDGVQLSNLFLHSSNVIWAAGNSASPLVKMLNTPMDKGGRAIVDEFCAIPDHPEVTVIGDAAHFSHGLTSPLQAVAQTAMQMGKFVSKNILRGDVAKPFRFSDYGSMATIGRIRAITEIHWLKYSGVIAWISWAGLHIVMLMGFRNRLKVLIEWIWYYISFQPGARLLMSRDQEKQHP